ncbi:MAG: hypothetical protein L0Y74_10620, partial [candidate division Zixibacteria bacterium]|nr:hypothetical protein [candidate division Zixibacteria bacterium]
MFYEQNLNKDLRFGDVIKGFISIIPVINNPNPLNNFEDFQIDVNYSNFFSVLSPCCNIDDKVISLAPLIKLRNTFFRNQYLVEDLTRINRPMTAQQAFPTDVWDSFSAEDKERRLMEG